MSQATKRTARQKHSFDSSNKSAAIDNSRRFFLCELVGELNLAFDSQIRAHNLEIESYGVFLNAFVSTEIDIHAGATVRSTNQDAKNGSNTDSNIGSVRAADFNNDSADTSHSKGVSTADFNNDSTDISPSEGVSNPIWPIVKKEKHEAISSIRRICAFGNNNG